MFRSRVNMHIISKPAVMLTVLTAVLLLPGVGATDDTAGYVSVKQLAEECRISMFFEELSNRVRLVGEDIEAVVAPGLDMAIINAEMVRLESRVRLYKGDVHVPEGFAEVVKARVEEKRQERRRKEKEAQEKGKKLVRVVIDPGHGGRFPGACAHGLQEKEINLSVAFKVKDLLEAEGIEVLMTRSRDTHLSDDLSTDLDRRCDFTNSKKADIFISIHANSSVDVSATGFEVFVARPNDELDRKSAKGARETPIAGEDLGGDKKSETELDKILWRALLKEYYSQGMDLAGKICEGLDANIMDDNRGVNNEVGFRVIKWTRCPAVLVEVGFMSHRGTAQKLATGSYRRKVARGIADGILEFKKEYDATYGFTKPK
jgi:N-acetylmuramoyl-L-alanine amidase